MLSRRLWVFVTFAMLANAQSVISTRSGVVHFFEGDVYLGDQLLQAHLGRFPMVPPGAELRTGEGRAEVLLTPNVFLRLDAHSTIRMVANDLADTQVELVAGNVIVESGVQNPGTSVTLIYQDWGVHFLRQGVYRIGTDPPRLAVQQGSVEVFAGDSSDPVSVDSGMSLPFTDVLAPENSTGAASDAMGDWQTGRSQSISADNAITAQIDEDPDMRVPGADDFIDFPLLGVPMVGMDPTALYGSAAMYQPGFNSIYLPGYVYRPMILSLVGLGLPGRYPIYISPTRFPGGSLPGTGGIGVISPLPRLPVLTSPPSGLRPLTPPVRIAAPPRIGGVGRR
jgi:hypothetical protein